MPTKRKKQSLAGPSLSPSAKKSRPDPANDETPSSSKPGPQPRNDPVYGQKHAFPGLDDEFAQDGELFYGPPEDGMEYLRMVRYFRSEANKLPVVFLAQETSVSGNKSDSSVRQHPKIDNGKSTAERRHEGTYSDGVYIAPRIEQDIRPSATAAEHEHENDADEESPDAQEAYYNLLRHRFLLLRSTLKCTPPPSAIAALDENHPISLPGNSRKARFEWRRLLQRTEPHMVQLACMDAESVLRIMTVVTRSLSEIAKSEDAEPVKRLGAWSWGLLGKCREVGQMGSEDVAEVRELGKRAVKILVKLRSPELRQALESEQGDSDNREEDLGPDEEPSDGEDGPQNWDAQGQEDRPTRDIEMRLEDPSSETAQGEVDELEMAKARLRQRLDATPAESEESIGAKQRVSAMLDMIISIVGEFYGQRDLLEFRDIWEEDSYE